MNRIETTAALALGLLLGAAAPGAAGPTDEAWTGRWSVEGGGSRTLEGGARLRLADPPDGLPVVPLEGSARGNRLRLEGRREGRKGVTHALDAHLGDGDAADAPEDVEVVVTGTRREEDGGRVVVDVRYDVRGGGASRTVEERWYRNGRADLEVVSVAPGRSYDSKADGDVAVTFRVIGAPQAVRLRVEVEDPGRIPADVAARRGQQRAAGFYREQGLWPAIREVDASEGALLEPGEHIVRWDGRDASSAERIALSGEYRLIVRSVRVHGDRFGLHRLPEDARRLFVAAPRWTLFGPRWPEDPDRGRSARDRDPAFDLMEPQLAGSGFRVVRSAEWFDDAAVDAIYDRLEDTASATFASHGNVGRVAIFTGDPDDPETFGETRAVNEAALRYHLGAQRPLRDVHSVFLWACLAGRSEATGLERAARARARLEPARADHPDLPAALIDLGVDLVVGFESSIIANAHRTFQDRVTRLLRGGASLTHASTVAAGEADAQYWKPLSADKKRELLADGLAPLRFCLRITAAAGVDPATERLIPARHGDSTN